MSKRYGRKKGLRRSYLKMFSATTVNTGRASHGQRWPNMTTREYYQRRERISNNEEIYLKREKEERLDEKVSKAFMTLFGVGMSEMYNIYFNQNQEKDPFWSKYHINPRTKVEQDLKELKKADLPKHHLLIQKSEPYRLWLFFTEDHREWFFYEQDLLNRRHRRSIVYPSRIRAMGILQIRSVTWFDYFPMASE